MSYVTNIERCSDCDTQERGGDLYGVRRQVERNGKTVDAIVILRRCPACIAIKKQAKGRAA